MTRSTLSGRAVQTAPRHAKVSCCSMPGSARGLGEQTQHCPVACLNTSDSMRSVVRQVQHPPMVLRPDPKVVRPIVAPPPGVLLLNVPQGSPDHGLRRHHSCRQLCCSHFHHSKMHSHCCSTPAARSSADLSLAVPQQRHASPAALLHASRGQRSRSSNKASASMLVPCLFAELIAHPAQLRQSALQHSGSTARRPPGTGRLSQDPL